MGPLEREMALRRGQRKLDAMKRRAGQLRRRVVATAIVGFAALWTVVFVQMATGNDPALATSAATPRSAARESGAPGPEPRNLQASVPPPNEEGEEDDSPTIPESEAARIEEERVAAEQFEAQQLEAEARELEELEAVTTGQS
jgi:hypothetical protein